MGKEPHGANEAVKYLSVLLPNFRMLSTEDFGVEVTVSFARD